MATSGSVIETDGFEFVEYTAPDPELLRTLFERMGFPVVARHRSKNVTLHRQGDINFIINAEPDSFGQRFAQQHGPSACAMAFRVTDAAQAFKRAIELGATPVAQPGRADGAQHPGHRGHRRQPDLPGRPLRRPHDLRRRLRAGVAGAEHDARGSHRHRSPDAQRAPRPHGSRGPGSTSGCSTSARSATSTSKARKTGLLSRAMTSPCGKIRIPINESQDDKSQIEEYLREYHGEGIQHIALATDGHLRAPSTRCATHGVEFQDTPDTYYEGVPGARARPSREPRRAASGARILIDGGGDEGVLLQIFTQQRHRPDLLRDHPAQGQRGIRRGQFPRAVRIDRARPGTRGVADVIGEMKRYIPRRASKATPRDRRIATCPRAPTSAR